MFRISRQLARIVTLLILVQFWAPAFISLFSSDSLPGDGLIYSEQHCAMQAPTFLKENSEKEIDEFSPETHLTPLFDLTTHAVYLNSIHTDKYLIFLQHSVLEKPTRFSLFCSFLI